MDKRHFMTIALEEAKKAYSLGEVPVGAVIVKKNKIIAKSHNETRTSNNPLRHAEIIVIEKASEHLQNERLIECDLYVTKEPCSMCAGAIVNSRVSRLIIGARDERYGACGTVLSVCGNRILNHIPKIEFGILENRSANLLKKFFKERRK